MGKEQTAKVLKAVFPKRERVIKNKVYESEREAELIRKNAEEYAAAIVREANETAHSLKEAGYRDGYESGLGELVENVIAAAKIRDQAVREAEQQIVELSVAIARRIIGKAIEADNKTVLGIAESGIRHVRHKQKLLIRVNPLDVETVILSSGEIEKKTGGKYIDVVPDTSVEAGGCIIESEMGTVDARIETQLKIIQKALTRARNKLGAGGNE